MTHNVQPKIAMINDISGFGRCSITVSLPVISQLQVQCCPLPTSIFSNHTGFPSFFFDDYTRIVCDQQIVTLLTLFSDLDIIITDNSS